MRAARLFHGSLVTGYKDVEAGQSTRQGGAIALVAALAADDLAGSTALPQAPAW
jgi:hypothetical protein